MYFSLLDDGMSFFINGPYRNEHYVSLQTPPIPGYPIICVCFHVTLHQTFKVFVTKGTSTQTILDDSMSGLQPIQQTYCTAIHNTELETMSVEVRFVSTRGAGQLGTIHTISVQQEMCASHGKTSLGHR